MFCKAHHHCQHQIQSSRTVMQNEPLISITRRKRIYQISAYHLLKVRLHSMHIPQLMKSWTHHKLRASLNCPRLSAWCRSVTNESKSTKPFRRRVVLLCFLDFTQRWGKCQGIAKNEDSPLPHIKEVFSWSNSSAPPPSLTVVGEACSQSNHSLMGSIPRHSYKQSFLPKCQCANSDSASQKEQILVWKTSEPTTKATNPLTVGKSNSRFHSRKSE